MTCTIGDSRAGSLFGSGGAEPWLAAAWPDENETLRPRTAIFEGRCFCVWGGGADLVLRRSSEPSSAGSFNSACTAGGLFERGGGGAGFFLLYAVFESTVGVSGGSSIEIVSC